MLERQVHHHDRALNGQFAEGLLQPSQRIESGRRGRRAVKGDDGDSASAVVHEAAAGNTSIDHRRRIGLFRQPFFERLDEVAFERPTPRTEVRDHLVRSIS